MTSRKIDTGWHQFRQVFAGENGVIYAIARDGKLLYYRHNQDFAWMVSSRAIGSGWQNADHLFSTGGGRIYSTIKDGELYYFLHNTALQWVVGNKGGIIFGDGGWDKGFGKLVLGSVSKDAPLPLRLSANHAWNRIDGTAIDIGAGPEGTVWHIVADKAADEWHEGKWIKRSGRLKLKRVDVAGHHEVWFIGENNEIWRVRHGKWTDTKAKGLDIGVGAGGHVFAVGTDRKPYE